MAPVKIHLSARFRGGNDNFGQPAITGDDIGDPSQPDAAIEISYIGWTHNSLPRADERPDNLPSLPELCSRLHRPPRSLTGT